SYVLLRLNRTTTNGIDSTSADNLRQEKQDVSSSVEFWNAVPNYSRMLFRITFVHILIWGVGPTMVVTTPYDREFFNAFGKAQSKFALGGYIGLGGNFGLDNSSLVGLNIQILRYPIF
ncbi:MAG: hypothetical protein MZV64_15660, partial [Ignavibacteriales bacterium]|nr:hypothetical protein [Ignavibacteriales bacterium]